MTGDAPRSTVVNRARPRLLPVLLLFAAVANLIPIWTVATLPMGDLGGHLELMDVVARRDDPATVYPDVYRMPDTPVAPNSIALAAAWALGRPLGVEVVARLLLSFYVVGFPLSLLLVARAFGRSPWLAFFGFPLAFNALLNVGFLDFLIALPLLLAAVAAARGLAVDGGRRAGLAVASLLVLAFFAHLLACLFALGLVAAVVALHARRARDLGRWLVAAPALLLVGAWGWRAIVQAVPTEAGRRFGSLAGLGARWDPLARRLADFGVWGLRYFRDATDDVVRIALLVCWLALWRAGARAPAPAGSGRWARLRARDLEALTLVCLAGFLVLPSDVHDAEIVAQRLVVPALALLALWPRLDARVFAERGMPRLALATVVGVAVAFPLFVRAEFARFERTQVGGLRAAIAALPDKSRLAVDLRVTTNPVTYMGPTWHLAKAFHAIENGGMTNDSFAVRSHTAVQYRPGRTPRSARPLDLAHWDYLLVRSDARPVRLPGMRLLYHEGAWWLYATR